MKISYLGVIRHFIVWGIGLALMALPVSGWGETYTVTRTDDFNFPGPEYCLRTAILAANSHDGSDIILLGSGTYTLSVPGTNENDGLTGDLDITDDLIIAGDGAAVTIINGNYIGRVFQVHSTVTNCLIADVSIQNGQESLDSDLGGGAGIYNENGATLTLNRVTVTSNRVIGTSTGSVGGGILNRGTLNLNDSMISGNQAQRGGGVFNSTGQMKVYRTTFSQNTADGGGGGAAMYGTSVFENCTFYGNTANNIGGGLVLDGVTEIRFCTITANISQVGGALTIYPSSTVTIHDSIVDDNYANDLGVETNCNCNNNFLSASRNIDGGISCGFSSDTNFNNTNARLNALADNGGPNYTCMPKPGSPAINSGGATSITTDQRGYPRSVQASPDIGSVETDYPPCVPISPIFLLLD